MKFKKVNAQAFFPLLNSLGLLLSAGFPIHASSFSSRQLHRSAQALPRPSKQAFPSHLDSHFHASTLFNFWGIHGSIFQDASGNQPVSGLFFRAPSFDCLVHPLDPGLATSSLGKSRGVVALKAHFRSVPLSPVITLFPHTFPHRPLHGAALSWRFPLLSYGDLRLGLHLPTKSSSFNRLTTISVTFSAAGGRATSPIWPVKNLAYLPSFMATSSAEATPQTGSASSGRASHLLQGQGANNASTLQPEQATHELPATNQPGITEREGGVEEQRDRIFIHGNHDRIGLAPEVTFSDKMSIEALIRSIHELCASLELKSLAGRNFISAKPLLSLLTPFEKENLTSEEVWQAFNTQHYDSVTLFQALACCGDEKVWEKIIDLAEETGTQAQLWESLIKPVGEFRTTPLDPLIKCRYEKTALSQIIDWLRGSEAQGVGREPSLSQIIDRFRRIEVQAVGREPSLSQIIDWLRGIKAQEVVWETSIKEAEKEKSTPLYYWLARYGAETLSTRLIKLAKEIGVQQQLWDLLIKEDASNPTTPLCYWLARYGSTTLEQLKELAKELGAQQQLWECLIKPVGKYRTTPLYWLSNHGTGNTLTQLTNFAQELGTQPQLLESLIEAGGSNKGAPLYWLAQSESGVTVRYLIELARTLAERIMQRVLQDPSPSKSEIIEETMRLAFPLTQLEPKNTLDQLTNFAKAIGAQKQLWEALLKEAGNGLPSPLRGMVLWAPQSNLTKLIEFAKEMGGLKQLWEVLSKGSGPGKTAPLYLLVRHTSGPTLTALLEFAKETGGLKQLWEVTIKEDGNGEITPPYWLTGDGGFKNLIEFAKAVGTQKQLWEALIKEKGKGNTSLLYWLAQVDGHGWALTQLIEFTKEIGAQAELWEVLIREEGNGSEKSTPLYWLLRHERRTSPTTEFIAFAKEIAAQGGQLWEGLLKPCGSDAHPVANAEASWVNLIELANNSKPQELWESLTKVINHFRKIPLYWVAQMGTETLWTSLIELAKAKHKEKLCDALELLVKIQIIGDISALLPPTALPQEELEFAQWQFREEMPLLLRQQEELLQVRERLFMEPAQIAIEIQKVLPGYDAFIEAILELPAMEASPMLDTAGFHFYFHYDSLSKGAIPYGALEMLLRLALNPGAADQIRDKALKIHNVHAQYRKLLEGALPSQKADQGMLHSVSKTITGCDLVVAWLYGNLSKRGKLWPTLVELLNLNLPQRSLEMNDHTESRSLYQSIATQRPYFRESLRKILGDSFNMIEGPSQTSEAQKASTQGPLV